MVAWKNKLFFVVLVGLALALYGLHYYLSSMEAKIYEKIQYHNLHTVQEISQNIEALIQRTLPVDAHDDVISYLQHHPEKRKVLENGLSILITKDMKYLYVVYQDTKGRFRFALDGSLEDKAGFNQKLDVLSPKWRELYAQGRYGFSLNDAIDSLYITSLYPIVFANRVQAMVVIDFSTTLQKEFEEMVEPIEHFFIALYLLVLLMLIISVVQAYQIVFMRKKTLIDTLTGAKNREFLRLFLEKEDISKYHVAMIDLDHFKRINDKYGHSIGDRLLQESCAIMQKLLRSSDHLIRYGGEEFVVLLKASNQHSSLSVIKRLRKAVEEYVLVDNSVEINVTISIGFNGYTNYFRTASEAIRVADMMLYRAKRNGRNRIEVYREGVDSLEGGHDHAFNVHMVREALDHERIICHFQPILSRDRDQIVKFEVLVRAITNDGELVAPGRFLPHIKHTSVYNDVTKRVIDHAIDAFEAYHVGMSINFSIDDLSNDDIINNMIKQLEKYPEFAHALTIEILEDDDLIDVDKIAMNINRLKALGVQIALDDFGKGFSNFYHILSLNIDILKIDGSLVQGIKNNQVSVNIIKAIVNFAQSSNVKTVAEFVSDEVTFEQIHQIGVDYLQGYYIGRPKEQPEKEVDLT
jgi:diguanylate cyclase (GGDEF)-like protein